MQDTVRVRKAIPADMEVLRTFEQGVIVAERPFDSTLKPTPIQYYDLPFLLSSDSALVLLAELGDNPVGCGYAKIEKAKSYLRHRNFAYLGFMYVLPAYRGKGINRLVIDNLKEWALQKGVTELRLEVYHDNTAAIKAYEKAGFQSLLVEMRMEMGM